MQGVIHLEKIGAIIHNHRIAKGLTQEELGSKVFVSKQAVSKWETGKTLPDIEMVRKLCEILDINRDEIFGSSIEETRKSRKWIKAWSAVSVISILTALFFGFGGVDYIQHHTQSGVAYLSVFSEGELCTTDEYEITGNLKSQDLKNGYKLHIGYGEIRGVLEISDQYEIEFGFVNTNNWHNIHIRLDIEEQNGHLSVKQTISYETEGNMYEVIVTEKTTTGNQVSVFWESV